MTAPIRKNPPGGTRLEAIVNALEVLRKDEEWEKSDDPRLRSLGVVAKLAEEPRIWMLPCELVRDHIVLPQIASVDGQAAADAMKSLLPHTLDKHVKDTCDIAKRRATARQRLAPDRDVSSLVVMAVMAVLYGRWQGGKSQNSQYVRAANHLGAERGAIRRIDEDFRRRAAHLRGQDLELHLVALHASIALVSSLPEMTSGPSRGRRQLSVAPRLVSSGVEQVTRRPSES